MRGGEGMRNATWKEGEERRSGEESRGQGEGKGTEGREEEMRRHEEWTLERRRGEEERRRLEDNECKVERRWGERRGKERIERQEQIHLSLLDLTYNGQ